MPAAIFGKIGPKPLIVAAAATAVAAYLGGYVWREEHRPAVLEIYVFAILSGRSIFIRTPDDKRILIDGGANSDIVKKLTEILPFYSHRIDVVIATNSDGKNVSGLIDILERYTVDKVIVPAITVESLGLSSSTDQIYPTLIEKAGSHDIPIQKVFAGERLTLDGNIANSATIGVDPKTTDKSAISNRKAVVADILFPAKPEKFSYSKASAPELLMRISYGANHILLAGSATPKIQKFIASSTLTPIVMNRNEQSVLIFPQNPSATNLNLGFVECFKVDYIIYSQTAANNSATIVKSSGQSVSPKKKPAKIPPDPLAGIPVGDRFNLKEQGTMRIVSDGIGISVDTF